MCNKCSVCGKRIGWFRKWRMKKLDEDPMHLVPLSQFCSDDCSEKGLNLVMEKLNKNGIKRSN